VLLTSLTLAPLSSLAAPDSSMATDDGIAEAIPPYVASFPSVEKLGMALTPGEELSGWRGSSDAKVELSGWGDPENTSSGSKGKYLPVLYSLLIPGTGEIALGYPKRGVALIVLEVAAWAGYAYYNSSGLDARDEFEAFADAHWDHDRWIINHPALEGITPKTFEQLEIEGLTNWSGWPGYHSYAAKDDVKLNYYENIGKYDWFISGWEDWDPVGKPMNTALRNQYRALRQESNDDLDTADRFIYLSIATRVFSLVETIILARRSGGDDEPAAKETSSYSFTSRSTGVASGEFAFVYRF
jgi:hypothetical protein